MINKIYEYAYKGKIIENVVQVTKETEKRLHVSGGIYRNINKDLLNKFSESEYYNLSHYDKPSLEEYKKALTEYKQFQINHYRHLIEKLENEISSIVTSKDVLSDE